ncbi:MAG: DUF1722 domain-containing protein [Chitinivibrionales bacterium]|nr:DUF1722 domain-containing protein [Chitinivibrionales bacterium]MBD3357269.1 DUF1722 domain-containing protein [Chitinivibrionales bacterium]
MNIRMGISSCLLGNNVRYDGTHKLDRYLRDILGRYVEWVPVCPEVECGLSVPREPIRLVGDPEAPRLFTVKSGIDLTERMQNWVRERTRELEREDLCGFVFKTKSPSCGMQGVKVYTERGMPCRRGAGLFARGFVAHLPTIPVEDEGRLHDPVLRENFIERIFTFSRWKEYESRNGTRAGLVTFHANHKYLIMAHSPRHLRTLGRLVGNIQTHGIAATRKSYIAILLSGLSLTATTRKNLNTLQHIAGYFKTLLTADEKREMWDIFEQYRDELIPLIVPIVLLQHYVRKYDIAYLKPQYYLHPHPAELKLRNHV